METPFPTPEDVDLPPSSADEWDAATVVRSPSPRDLADVRTPPDKPRRGREEAPFNPEETVAMAGDIHVDLDFQDETRKPRRR